MPLAYWAKAKPLRWESSGLLVVTGATLFLRHTLESFFDVTAATGPGDLVAL